MNKTPNKDIAKNLIRIRLSQMLINEKLKNGAFKIPIHLAFGHEAISVAVDATMSPKDQLVLSHRNIHYNMARLRSLKPQLAEYFLRKDGLAKGQLGSMNLANEAKGLVYTSSILGNNLSVASGLALGKKVKKESGVIFVVTGDGAMEEGSFYESLVFLKANSLPCIIIVENNGWSMYTRIKERRCEIDLSTLTKAINIPYIQMKGNNPYNYIEILTKAKNKAIKLNSPICIEVNLLTLGGFYLEDGKKSNKRFINYHTGMAPKIKISEWPVIDETDNDPIFVLSTIFGYETIRKLSKDMLEFLMEDINEIY